ncbi:MAG: HAMP domain-containing sensor histidine kinase [Actinomycetota bacterium]
MSPQSRARSAIERTRLRLPIRLKLAVVSAGLTFVILALFALVVGGLTERRLVSSFDDDLRATTADLQERFRVSRGPDGEPRLETDRDIVRGAAAGDSAIRVVDRNGRVIDETTRAPDLGPPFEGVRDIGAFRVSARPLFEGSLDRTGSFNLDPSPIDGAVAFVQYAKPRRSLESTTGRLHLFLAVGIFGGTMLAFLAGFAVARRAMRPIAGLTRAAREVARTRDPALTLPHPAANDEVAELAETLEDMLRQLDAARSETEHALQRQREFVADASHELRTPLTSILANLELLEDELTRDGGPRDRVAAGEIAGSALRSSRRMRRLVGDLLLLARADAGRQAPRRPVDLTAVTREAAGEAAPLASGQQVQLDLPAEGVTVEGSPDDLHRLVLNLIENALIHTPSGTPVIASVRRSGDEVELQVADRGPGVPAELRDRIFDRFAHGTPGSVSSGGSGLGLAIVRAVSQAHGGTVRAGDAEGGGAVFTVRLPATTPIRTPGGGVPQEKPSPSKDRQGDPAADVDPKGAQFT